MPFIEIALNVTIYNNFNRHVFAHKTKLMKLKHDKCLYLYAKNNEILFSVQQFNSNDTGLGGMGYGHRLYKKTIPNC